jgi:hypothetical protein
MQNCRVSFRHLWQCHDFSDVQLLLKVPFDQAQTHDAVVHQMPAHKVGWLTWLTAAEWEVAVE